LWAPSPTPGGGTGAGRMRQEVPTGQPGVLPGPRGAVARQGACPVPAPALAPAPQISLARNNAPETRNANSLKSLALRPGEVALTCAGLVRWQIAGLGVVIEVGPPEC
jgi:hypothetical protein